jgi:hypothetical protein
MNARGRVMDARRNMEVAANRLEAVLNVVAQGNLNTPPGVNHPLDFRGAFSTFQFGLQMTAPLDQMQVRNLYRQSLVSYQQSRRAYMLLEDQVKYDVRTSWRQLKVNRQNFETARKNLRQAAIQFDINVANNLNPRGAGGGAGAAVGTAGTTGNLGSATGLNIIQAANTLLNAQNTLIQNWVAYERNRINIYKDMDIMQVDERGLWIDPVYQNLGGRATPTTDEPANEFPPEPSARNQSADVGLVRLIQGPGTATGEVSVEKASHPAASPGRFGQWWRRRVAGNSGTNVPSKGRD